MSDILPKPAKSLNHGRQLWAVCHSPCGKYLLAAGNDAQVLRWDLSAAEPAPLAPLAGHHGWIQRLAAVGELVLSADSWGRLAAWRIAQESAEPLWSHEQALSGWIRALAASPDGSTLAVAGNDPAVRLYSAADGKLLSELPPHPEDIFSLAFHPDGKSLVTGDLKGELRHWDLAGRKIVRQWNAADLYRLDRLQDCGGVRQLAFDAGGKRLLCGGQKNPGGGFAEGAPLVLVFDWESGKVEHELQHGDKSQGFIYDTLFHPAGFVIATSGAMPKTGHLWFWRPGEPKPYFAEGKYANGRGLSLTSDGSRLAVVTCVAPNANGRPKGSAYVDGTSTIHLLDLAAAAD